MATLNIEARTAGMQQTQDAFDKLSAAEQKAVVAGSALGKQLDSHKRHKDVFAEMGKGVLQFAGALGIATSAQGLLSAGIGKIREEYERLVALQKAAATTQQTFGEAMGGLLANNPLENKAFFERARAFALREGAVLGAAGPAMTIQGLTALRGAVPEGTEAQQEAAMKAAIRQALIDPSTNLGQFATAALKIQLGAGIGGQQAANVLGVYGARAGGDIATLAGTIPALAASAGPRAPLSDILALHAFGTTVTGDTTGEKTSRAVRQMVSDLATKDLRVGGRAMRFKSGNVIDRLQEGIAAIAAGQYGDPEKALVAFAEQLGEGEELKSIVKGVAKGGATFADTRRFMRGAAGGTEDLQAQLLAIKGQLGPGKSQEAIKTAEGERSVAELFDAQAEWERAGQRVQNLRDRLGMDGLGPIPGKGVWGWLARTGGLAPGPQERAAVSGVLQELLVGAGATSEQAARVEAVFRGGGMDAALGEFARAGLVSPAGGINRAESEALRMAGVTDEQLERMGRLWADGAQQAFVDAFREIVTPLIGGPRPVPVNAGEVAP